MIAHLTRREMYQLVWADPLEVAASRLGIPHWRLKDLCIQHRVPLPTPGYWREKKAGKTPRQTLFVSAADPSIELIKLDPSGPTDSALEARLEQARQAAAVPRRLRTPREPNPRVIEWTRVNKPHGSLSLTANALRRAKSKEGIIEIGGESLLSLRLGAGSVERTIYLLDTIARALEPRAITCAFVGTQIRVRRGADSIPIVLAETIKRQKHDPTVDELKAEERYRRGRSRDWATPYERQYPEFDYLPTGELTISVEAWSNDRRRRSWRDNSRATLEAQLGHLVEDIEGWIDYKQDDRLQRERWERLHRRSEDNRRRGEASKKREGERDALLDEIVEMGRKAEQLRSWIAWADNIEDAETQRMLSWARYRLAALEKALDPASFGDWLRQRQLFPETDPFAPLPDDPDIDTSLSAGNGSTE